MTARDVPYATADGGPRPRVRLRTAGRLLAHLMPRLCPTEVHFSHNLLHKQSVSICSQKTHAYRARQHPNKSNGGRAPAPLPESSRPPSPAAQEGAAPRTVETLLVSSTVPRRCKGWLRACALQPTSQRPQTSGWRGPQAWDPHGPRPTQGLEWTVQLVLLQTRGPGSPGGGSELKFRVSAKVTACAAGAPPWASGEPGVQQPPVRVGVGGAATPPSPGHLGLPGQSERSTTLSRV